LKVPPESSQRQTVVLQLRAQVLCHCHLFVLRRRNIERFHDQDRRTIEVELRLQAQPEGLPIFIR
jgi:hypothetical protein